MISLGLQPYCLPAMQTFLGLLRVPLHARGEELVTSPKTVCVGGYPFLDMDQAQKNSPAYLRLVIFYAGLNYYGSLTHAYMLTKSGIIEAQVKNLAVH